MPTLRQIEANRQNAQRSTGPKTEQGKATSCLNNLKHGLRAATLVLPHENQEDCDREYQNLLDQCQPVGPIEHHYVEQMLDNRWKAIRVNVLIESVVDDARESAQKWFSVPKGEQPSTGQMLRRLTHPVFHDSLEYLERMQERYDRAYLRAERRLAQIQKERRKHEEQLHPMQPHALPAEERDPRPVAREFEPATPPAAVPEANPPAAPVGSGAKPVHTSAAAPEPEHKPPAVTPLGPGGTPMHS